MNSSRLIFWTFATAFLAFLSNVHAASVPLCEIQIIDQENDWPVPMVELSTTHHLHYVSDNAGRIAVDAPELMGRETWFAVEGQGYTVPADGFGYRGVRVLVQAGKSEIIRVQRASIAKRIGRLTGGGLFAESQKLGFEGDQAESGLLGCDSVQMTLLRGKLFWAWGDTTLAHYPLGIFHMIGATTDLRSHCRWEPPLKIHYDYNQILYRLDLDDPQLKSAQNSKNISDAPFGPRKAQKDTEGL